jgi:hypothetical protein
MNFDIEQSETYSYDREFLPPRVDLEAEVYRIVYYRPDHIEARKQNMRNFFYHLKLYLSGKGNTDVRRGKYILDSKFDRLSRSIYRFYNVNP